MGGVMGPNDKELNDYDNERDASVLNDIERRVQDDYENSRITDENYNSLIEDIQQEREEAKQAQYDNDYPNENMGEEDSPFGTGD